MSCKLGLWIGGSFAELRGLSGGGSTQSRGQSSVESRWFLPKKSLADGLREALAQAEIKSGTLIVATSRIDRPTLRNQAETGSLAFLVTAGFETWLRSAPPHSTHSFSRHPTREPLQVPEDQIFGISERITADGKINKALQLEELEFLVAKLQLLKVKDVAIGFLNSHLNPEHERQTGNYLREKGFRVTLSHGLKGENERERWRMALALAHGESTLHEISSELRSALEIPEDKSAESAWTIQFSGHQGLAAFEQASASDAQGGLESVLSAGLTSRISLHFGIERFSLIDNSPSGLRVIPLSIQPTKQIGMSALMFPTLIEEDRGYEPGPMLFGKSHQLTFLDVLSIRDRLPATLPGFDHLISERSRSRILESLFTLGKLVPEKKARTIDAGEIANDLELLCIEQLATTLNCTLGSQGEVTLAGPLSPCFADSLKTRLPNLTFKTAPQAEWILPNGLLAKLEGAAAR